MSNKINFVLDQILMANKFYEVMSKYLNKHKIRFYCQRFLDH